MKISEILKLAKTKTIEEIAKEYLTIDEKSVRLSLKQAGYFCWAHEPNVWIQDEHENPLNGEKSIYEFHKKRLKDEYSVNH